MDVYNKMDKKVTQESIEQYFKHNVSRAVDIIFS